VNPDTDPEVPSLQEKEIVLFLQSDLYSMHTSNVHGLFGKQSSPSSTHCPSAMVSVSILNLIARLQGPLAALPLSSAKPAMHGVHPSPDNATEELLIAGPAADKSKRARRDAFILSPLIEKNAASLRNVRGPMGRYSRVGWDPPGKGWLRQEVLGNGTGAELVDPHDARLHGPVTLRPGVPSAVALSGTGSAGG
jgi:hypothetical protein